MKRIKQRCTPILVFLSILSIIFLFELILCTWNPFFFLAIVLFIIEVLGLLALDYILLHSLQLKYVWIIETILIILTILVSLLNNWKLFDIIFCILP